MGGRKEEKEKDTKGRRKRRGGKRGCREEKTGGGRKKGGREGWKRWYFRASWPKESRATRTCPEFETFDSRLPTFLPSLSLSFSPSVNLTVSPPPLSLSLFNRVNEIPPRLDTTRYEFLSSRDEIGVPRLSVDRSMPKMNFSQE